MSELKNRNSFSIAGILGALFLSGGFLMLFIKPVIGAILIVLSLPVNLAGRILEEKNK
jgi:hypothetical protein